jgi:F0F1-type ATP synthase assembly protein I
MKSVFTKEYGKIEEKLILTIERKWVHIDYYKGNFKKSAFILKNEPDAVTDYADKFLIENNVSEEIQIEVKELLIKDKRHIDINFQQYLNVLVTSSSAHLVVGFTLALCILLGYKIGNNLDHKLNLYPSYTVIGIVVGIIIGILVGYIMMVRNTEYFSTKSKHSIRKDSDKNADWPLIEPTLNEVRIAISKFSKDLPQGIHRNILVHSDNSIDFEKLAPYLGGISSKPFYMSKETYDIFEEKDKHIPTLIDQVQRAVYLFYKKHNEYPIMPYDPYRTVNYYQLIQGNYLFEHPKIKLYVSDHNGLITYQKPQIKLARARKDPI